MSAPASGVGRLGGSGVGMSAGSVSVWSGRNSRIDETAVIASSSSATTIVATPLAVAWTADPPSSAPATSTPVNVFTIAGPLTHAYASVVITTTSQRPSRRAGPDTAGPVNNA